jgi:hypothetical protein
VAAALAGCGGGTKAPAVPAAPTSPAAAPSLDDSGVNVVPPSGAAPDAVTTGSPGGGSTPAPGASSSGRQPASVVPPVGASGGGNGDVGTVGLTGRTVPGLPDGAVALPQTAKVSDDGRCRPGALKLEPVDLQGSPGGTYADFRLVNVSPAACAVRGYVTATLIGDAGNPLATTVRHEASPEAWVEIAPKGAAQFHLRFPNPMSGDTPCNPPNAARVRVGLPAISGTLTSSTPEGGIQACHGDLSTAPLGST